MASIDETQSQSNMHSQGNQVTEMDSPTLSDKKSKQSMEIGNRSGDLPSILLNRLTGEDDEQMKDSVMKQREKKKKNEEEERRKRQEEMMRQMEEEKKQQEEERQRQKIQRRVQ